LLDTSAQARLGGGEAADFVGQDIHQVGPGGNPAGRSQSALEIIPDAFIRIQFGSIGGKRDKMKTASTSKKLLHRFGAMDFTVVHQSDNMAAHLAQQMAKEQRHFIALDVVLIKLTIEHTMKSFWTDGNAGNGGDTIVAIVIRQNRSLPNRSPSSENGGNEQETGFINKY